MRDHGTKVRVGIFTFVTGALVAVVLVVFGGMRFWKHRDRYYVEFADSVMGLTEGAQVFFGGIQVGSVSEIALDPDDPALVRVAIDVDRGTPIRTDTQAYLEMAGITGLKIIDLKGGSPRAPVAEPGTRIAVGKSTLDKLSSRAEELAQQSGAMMTRANEILDGTSRVVRELEAVTDPARLGAIVDATRDTSRNLAHASRQIDELVAENRAALRTTLGSVSRASTNVEQAAGDVRALVRTNQGTISATLADIRQAARTFKDLAREVREKPSRLMFSGALPDRKLP
jgi:phospholipid/cholesterol/gamma-HCH transport system substrate-binding protein